MSKKHGIILFVALMAGISLQAQRSTHIGLSVGAATLSGANGFIFDVPTDIPHREYDLSGGLSLYVPLDNDLHVILGAHGHYEKSHFHADVLPGSLSLPTGYFEFTYMQFPITLNHMGLPLGGSDWVLKEFFGFAFNYAISRGPKVSTLAGVPFSYETEVAQKWELAPEFMMGIGVASRPRGFGSIHLHLSLHIDVNKSRFYHARIIPEDGAPAIIATSEVQGIKGMINLVYFPRIHIKKKQCYRN